MPGVQKTNRMELLRVRRRLRVARRGHKLLQNKRDKLIQEFLRYRKQERVARLKTVELMQSTYRAYGFAAAAAPSGHLDAVLPFSPISLTPATSRRRVLNVEVVNCRLEVEAPVLRYGMVGTTADLDNAVESGARVLETLAELASIEGVLIRLAQDIEKTRRMVNNLEYIVIPELEAEEQGIFMRLELRQMENISQLQRIKEIIRVGRGSSI